MTNCKRVITQEKVDKMVSRHPFMREQVHEAMLKKYLAAKEDIRLCPKEGCNYAGVIDARPGACVDALTCNKCKTEWRDPLHMT